MNKLAEAIPLPTIVVGRDARIQIANAHARQLLGENLLGRHYVTIFRQPVILDAIELALADGGVRTARFLTTEAQKDRTWVAHVAALSDESGIVVTLEDHTATEEAGQMRRDFVANVSHELKTPLTALMGFIETMKGAAKDDPAARQRFLDIMEREAWRMNRLVTDLMSLNRVESEERHRPSARVDVGAQARSVLKVMSPLAERHGVTLRSIGLDTRTVILGDADQVSQVITNLVENAIKYSGSGRQVTVSLEAAEHHPMVLAPAVVLKVSDTGDGIPPELIPRLTERFYRIDNHRSREMGGTGLGLAIVKHIVNRHRGRLRIRSEIGQGTEFSVVLPRLAGNDAGV